MEATTTEAPAHVSRWEDFIDIFLSPVELFRRRRNDSPAVPLVVLLVMLAGLMAAFLPVTGPLWEAMAMRNMTPEQLEAMQSAGGNAQRMMGVMSVIFAPISIGIAMLIGALLTWVLAKMSSVEMGYKQSLNFTTWSAYPGILQTIGIGIAAMLATRSGQALDPIRTMSFGVLRFMPNEDMSPAMLAVLGRIDLFAIWQLVLLALALEHGAGASKGKAWMIALITWLAYTLPALLAAL